MTRKFTVPLLLAAIVAVPMARAGNYMSSTFNAPNGEGYGSGPRFVREAPTYIGPHGTPIPILTSAGVNGEPSGADYARAVLTQSIPAGMLAQAKISGDPRLLNYGHIQQTSGAYAGGTYGPVCPPSMPGPPIVGPPGLPTANQALNAAGYGPPGAVAAVGVVGGPGGGGPGGVPFGSQRTEVRFVGPAGMKISWYAPKGEGKAGFTSQYLEAPARYNFLQASIYRLKLSDVPGRPGVELYPTLEIVPANAKTATFLAHAAVPVNFTEEDFEQVAAGNFIVKVIYLPDPQFQDLAATGPDEVVSSRLEPGVDPIVEARRRGSILAVVRLGNIDLEAPNTPAMDAPDASHHASNNSLPPGAIPVGPMMPPGMSAQMRPGMMPPGMMQPGMMPPGMGMMQPGMAMMPPGMMQPGMMPPGMMPPGMMHPGMMPPGMMPPGAAPTMPGMPKSTTPVKTPTPSGPAPKAPAPIKADEKAIPLGQGPVMGDDIQRTSATVPAKDASRSRPPRTTLADLLGQNSGSR